MPTARPIAAAFGLVGAYVLAVRGATRSATMACTIGAPPSEVWPWLVQMGVDRGGWYSWDRLDNFGHPLDLRGRPFDPATARPRFYTDSTWGFLLEELPGSRTRLVVSGYWSLQPRWLRPVLSAVFLEPSHWIMQTRQFANVKRRVAAAKVGP